MTLLLIGIGLSSLAGALMSLALNLAPNPYSLSDLVNWMMGSVANRSWADLLLALPAWALGAAPSSGVAVVNSEDGSLSGSAF